MLVLRELWVFVELKLRLLVAVSVTASVGVIVQFPANAGNVTNPNKIPR